MMRNGRPSRDASQTESPFSDDESPAPSLMASITASHRTGAVSPTETPGTRGILEHRPKFYGQSATRAVLTSEAVVAAAGRSGSQGLSRFVQFSNGRPPQSDGSPHAPSPLALRVSNQPVSLFATPSSSDTSVRQFKRPAGSSPSVFRLPKRPRLSLPVGGLPAPQPAIPRSSGTDQATRHRVQTEAYVARLKQQAIEKKRAEMLRKRIEEPESDDEIVFIPPEEAKWILIASKAKTKVGTPAANEGGVEASSGSVPTQSADRSTESSDLREPGAVTSTTKTASSTATAETSTSGLPMDPLLPVPQLETASASLELADSVIESASHGSSSTTRAPVNLRRSSPTSLDSSASGPSLSSHPAALPAQNASSRSAVDGAPSASVPTGSQTSNVASARNKLRSVANATSAASPNSTTPPGTPAPPSAQALPVDTAGSASSTRRTKRSKQSLPPVRKVRPLSVESLASGSPAVSQPAANPEASNPVFPQAAEAASSSLGTSPKVGTKRSKQSLPQARKVRPLSVERSAPGPLAVSRPAAETEASNSVPAQAAEAASSSLGISSKVGASPSAKSRRPRSEREFASKRPRSAVSTVPIVEAGPLAGPSSASQIPPAGSHVIADVSRTSIDEIHMLALHNDVAQSCSMPLSNDFEVDHALPEFDFDSSDALLDLTTTDAIVTQSVEDRFAVRSAPRKKAPAPLPAVPSSSRSPVASSSRAAHPDNTQDSPVRSRPGSRPALSSSEPAAPESDTSQSLAGSSARAALPPSPAKAPRTADAGPAPAAGAPKGRSITQKSATERSPAKAPVRDDPMTSGKKTSSTGARGKDSPANRPAGRQPFARKTATTTHIHPSDHPQTTPPSSSQIPASLGPALSQTPPAALTQVDTSLTRPGSSHKATKSLSTGKRSMKDSQLHIPRRRSPSFDFAVLQRFPMSVSRNGGCACTHADDPKAAISSPANFFSCSQNSQNSQARSGPSSSAPANLMSPSTPTLKGKSRQPASSLKGSASLDDVISNARRTYEEAMNPTLVTAKRSKRRSLPDPDTIVLEAFEHEPGCDHYDPGESSSFVHDISDMSPDEEVSTTMTPEESSRPIANNRERAESNVSPTKATGSQPGRVGVARVLTARDKGKWRAVDPPLMPPARNEPNALDVEELVEDDEMPPSSQVSQTTRASPASTAPPAVSKPAHASQSAVNAPKTAKQVIRQRLVQHAHVPAVSSPLAQLEAPSAHPSSDHDMVARETPGHDIDADVFGDADVRVKPSSMPIIPPLAKARVLLSPEEISRTIAAPSGAASHWRVRSSTSPSNSGLHTLGSLSLSESGSQPLSQSQSQSQSQTGKTAKLSFLRKKRARPRLPYLSRNVRKGLQGLVQAEAGNVRDSQSDLIGPDHADLIDGFLHRRQTDETLLSRSRIPRKVAILCKSIRFVVGKEDMPFDDRAEIPPRRTPGNEEEEAVEILKSAMMTIRLNGNIVWRKARELDIGNGNYCKFVGRGGDETIELALYPGSQEITYELSDLKDTRGDAWPGMEGGPKTWVGVVPLAEPHADGLGLAWKESIPERVDMRVSADDEDAEALELYAVRLSVRYKVSVDAPARLKRLETKLKRVEPSQIEITYVTVASPSEDFQDGQFIITSTWGMERLHWVRGWRCVACKALEDLGGEKELAMHHKVYHAGEGVVDCVKKTEKNTRQIYLLRVRVGEAMPRPAAVEQVAQSQARAGEREVDQVDDDVSAASLAAADDDGSVGMIIDAAPTQTDSVIVEDAAAVGLTDDSAGPVDMDIDSDTAPLGVASGVALDVIDDQVQRPALGAAEVVFDQSPVVDHDVADSDEGSVVELLVDAAQGPSAGGIKDVVVETMNGISTPAVKRPQKDSAEPSMTDNPVVASLEASDVGRQNFGTDIPQDVDTIGAHDSTDDLLEDIDIDPPQNVDPDLTQDVDIIGPDDVPMSDQTSAVVAPLTVDSSATPATTLRKSQREKGKSAQSSSGVAAANGAPAFETQSSASKPTRPMKHVAFAVPQMPSQRAQGKRPAAAPSPAPPQPTSGLRPWEETAELQPGEEIPIPRNPLGLMHPQMQGRQNEFTTWSSRVAPGSALDLIPELDKLWDGGKYRYLLRLTEERNIFSWTDKPERVRFMCMCWGRWRDERGPLASCRQASVAYLRGWLDKYAPIMRRAELDQEVTDFFYTLYAEDVIDDRSMRKAIDHWLMLAKKERLAQGRPTEQDIWEEAHHHERPDGEHWDDPDRDKIRPLPGPDDFAIKTIEKLARFGQEGDEPRYREGTEDILAAVGQMEEDESDDDWQPGGGGRRRKSAGGAGRGRGKAGRGKAGTRGGAVGGKGVRRGTAGTGRNADRMRGGDGNVEAGSEAGGSEGTSSSAGLAQTGSGAARTRPRRSVQARENRSGVEGMVGEVDSLAGGSEGSSSAGMAQTEVEAVRTRPRRSVQALEKSQGGESKPNVESGPNGGEIARSVNGNGMNGTHGSNDINGSSAIDVRNGSNGPSGVKSVGVINGLNGVNGVTGLQHGAPDIVEVTRTTMTTTKEYYLNPQNRLATNVDGQKYVNGPA